MVPSVGITGELLKKVPTAHNYIKLYSKPYIQEAGNKPASFNFA